MAQEPANEGTVTSAGASLLDRLHDLTVEARTVYYVLTDPRVPLHAKVVVVAVMAYVVNPFDLIPDWIPLAGWVDDAIIVPLGLALAKRLVGEDLYEELRAKAARRAGAPSAGPLDRPAPDPSVA